MAVVHVGSLSMARRKKRQYEAILTIEDPHFRNGVRFHRNPHPVHLVLRFEDVDKDLRPRIAAASEEQVEAAIEFGRDNVDRTMLVHCRAGIARSAALALAIIADRDGPGVEDASVSTLLSVRPESVPNLHVLGIADRFLGRDGRLTEAWMSVERTNPAYARFRAIKARMIIERPSDFAPGLPEGVTGIYHFPARDRILGP